MIFSLVEHKKDILKNTILDAIDIHCVDLKGSSFVFAEGWEL